MPCLQRCHVKVANATEPLHCHRRWLIQQRALKIAPNNLQVSMQCEAFFENLLGSPALTARGIASPALCIKCHGQVDLRSADGATRRR